MSYEPVPNGELAAVVTYLEMHARPARGSNPLPTIAAEDRTAGP